MRKRNITFILLLLLFILSACSNLEKKEAVTIQKIEASPDNNQYVIEAHLNTIDKTLSALQQVTYINNTDIELKEIYFHVYPNAFKNKETAPAKENSSVFIPGYTDFKSIEAITDKGNVALKYEFLGQDATILKIDLPYILGFSEKIKLQMEYTVHIPPARYRFGYADVTINLANWYPIAAVYDKKGWNIDRYYAIGEPFYSDAADYNVTITTPKEFTIAGTGYLLEDRIEGQKRFWNFEANSVRDFAMIACDRYQVIEENVDGIIVKSYYYKDDEKYGQIALEHGVAAISAFNGEYGKYPYPCFTIAEVDCPKGIELSGIVCINDLYYYNDAVFQFKKWRLLRAPFKRFVTRGVARQWWYNIVGHDQINESWLGGGFTRYSEGLFIEIDQKDKSASMDYFWSEVEPNVNSLVGIGDYDIKVSKPLSEFKYNEEYKASVQDKGALLLYNLRQELGDDAFRIIMKEYYHAYKFKNATAQDFINTCKKNSDKSLEHFFAEWL